MIKRMTEIPEDSRRSSYEILGFRDRSKMVTFIKADGTRYSANYAFLHSVWGVDCRLRLDFGKSTVVIEGEGLRALQSAFGEHRVVFVSERFPSNDGQAGSIVSRINIISRLSDDEDC